jgi:hypothetical protein
MNSWEEIVDALWDPGSEYWLGDVVPGVDLMEILSYAEQDYDWVDRLYVEHETQGGE